MNPHDVPLIQASELLIGYDRRPILPKASFGIWAGQVTSIVGHKGSGKSSLLKILLGLLKPIGGELIRSPEIRLGYVPRRSSIDPIYPIRVEQLVESGTYIRLGAGKRLPAKLKERFWECMEATRVMTLADELFRTLKDSEQQRVLLARALASEPNLLILDDPTASMDLVEAEKLMEFTLELSKRRSVGIVMVNHNLDMVARVSDQVILLDRDYQEIRVGHPKHVLPGKGGA